MRIDTIKLKTNRNQTKNENIDELAKSIKEIGGLITPVIIGKNRELISGYRRLKALKRIGIKTLKRSEYEMLTFDKELTRIASDLDFEALSPSERDKLLSARKKLRGDKLSFSKVQARKSKVSVRTIQRSAKRMKTSPAVQKAYERNAINRTVVNLLTQLPKKTQTALLPVCEKVKGSHLKEIINVAKENPGGAFKRAQKLTHPGYSDLMKIIQLAERLTSLIDSAQMSGHISLLENAEKVDLMSSLKDLEGSIESFNVPKIRRRKVRELRA